MEELPAAFQEEDVGGRMVLVVEKLACFDGAHEAPGPTAYDDDTAGIRRVRICCRCVKAVVVTGGGGGGGGGAGRGGGG
jgi:hypothetical protein